VDRARASFSPGPIDFGLEPRFRRRSHPTASGARAVEPEDWRRVDPVRCQFQFTSALVDGDRPLIDRRCGDGGSSRSLIVALARSSVVP
jgi:hypothetical protein